MQYLTLSLYLCFNIQWDSIAKTTLDKYKQQLHCMCKTDSDYQIIGVWINHQIIHFKHKF